MSSAGGDRNQTNEYKYERSGGPSAVAKGKNGRSEDVMCIKTVRRMNGTNVKRSHVCCVRRERVASVRRSARDVSVELECLWATSGAA